MKLENVTTQELVDVLESVPELFKSKKYKNKDYIEKFLSLMIHRNGFYGLIKENGEIIALDLDKTEFTSKEDVVFLIEGIVDLKKEIVINGGGNAIFRGRGSLNVNNVSIFDGRALIGGNADSLNGLNSSNFVKTSTQITPDLNTYYTAGMVGFNTTTVGAPYTGFGQVLCIVNVNDSHNESNYITQLAFGTDLISSFFRTKVGNNSWGSWIKIWNSENDGAGSGLDADLLDGINSSGFVKQFSTSLDAIDLNDIKISGSYRVNINCLNMPINSYLSMVVVGNMTTVVSQRVTDFQTGETWIRSFNTDWSVWRKVWDSENTNGAVTNTKLADMVANSVKTRGSSVAGVPSDTVLGVGQVLGRPKSGNLQALTRVQQRENIGLLSVNSSAITGNFSANTRREFSVSVPDVLTTSFISVVPNATLANDIKNANAIFTCIGRCELNGTVIIDAVSNTNITISANSLFRILVIE